ncbi:MAG: hypothetical protein KDK36_22025, partial [Leptospiraceae bacterium]|nr:hypothetical protein [Leptospiraceae bacterium]
MKSLLLKTKILIAFSIILILSIVLSILSINFQINSINSLDFTNSNIIKPIERLKKISDLYAIDIVDESHKIRNGNIDFETGLKFVKNAKVAINLEWEKFLKLEKTESNSSIIKESIKVKKNTDESVNKLISILEKKDK